MTKTPTHRRKVQTVAALALVVFSISCRPGVSHIQTKALPQPNPTSYVFPFPVEEVRARALMALSFESQGGRPIFGRPPGVAASAGSVPLERLIAVEVATNAVFSKNVFSNPQNTNDLYLHTFHTPFVTSSVYQGGKGGLPFIASFHVHLTETASNTTAVTVTALDPEVINGTEFGFGSCGPGYAWRCEKVKPTTVEEYTILRYLGRSVGVTNMPDIILPPR